MIFANNKKHLPAVQGSDDKLKRICKLASSNLELEPRQTKKHSPEVKGSDEKMKPRITKIGDKGGHLRGERQMIFAPHENHRQQFRVPMTN